MLPDIGEELLGNLIKANHFLEKKNALFLVNSAAHKCQMHSETKIFHSRERHST